MSISAGAKKDLMVVYFCYSTIKISLEDIGDAEIKQRKDNKNHKLNKRIDRRLEKLMERLEKTISYFMSDYDVATWIRRNLDKRIGKTLLLIQESTLNLEFLALFILYVNFCERDKPLHAEFQWLEDPDIYFNITELIADTKISDLESELFLMAYDIVQNIKG